MNRLGHAAQCLLCQHARRNTASKKREQGIPLPIGCQHFDPEKHGPVGEVVNGILYQLAAKNRCIGFERLELQADGYWAQDLPILKFTNK